VPGRLKCVDWTLPGATVKAVNQFLMVLKYIKIPLTIKIAETNNPNEATLLDLRSVLRLKQTMAIKMPANIATECDGN
jgi:hypothetical protein